MSYGGSRRDGYTKGRVVPNLPLHSSSICSLNFDGLCCSNGSYFFFFNVQWRLQCIWICVNITWTGFFFFNSDVSDIFCRHLTAVKLIICHLFLALTGVAINVFVCSCQIITKVVIVTFWQLSNSKSVIVIVQIWRTVTSKIRFDSCKIVNLSLFIALTALTVKVHICRNYQIINTVVVFTNLTTTTN